VLLYQIRHFINGKVEEKTAGDGPSLATMFEDDRHGEDDINFKFKFI